VTPPRLGAALAAGVLALCTLLGATGPRRRLGARWGPGRARVCVADRRWAVLARREAALSAPAPPRAPGPTGRPRRTGHRRPPVAAVGTAPKPRGPPGRVAPWAGAGPRAVEGATDGAVWAHTGPPPGPSRGGLLRAPQACGKAPAVVAPPLAETPEPRRPGWGRRGPRAVPLEAARTPRGMATPRHWPARALARPPPALVSLDARLPRTAHRRRAPGATGRRRTAWERTPPPTCADARAWGRRPLGGHSPLSLSHQETDMRDRPRALCERFTDAVC
jgi:hypothetical protein